MTENHPLNFESGQKGSYYIIRLLDEDPGQRGDLSELVDLVQANIEEGKRNIAVVFSKSTLLYTRSIAALVRCYAMLDDVEGKLIVVAQNPHLAHAIQIAGIDTIIKTFSSEDEIPV
jgi:anti-anti-sigma regulatory factor